MNASVLFGAGWENDSVEVLWRDAGRAFCRLWRNDAEDEKHAFISIPADVDHPTLESVNRLTHEHRRRAARSARPGANGNWTVPPTVDCRWRCPEQSQGGHFAAWEQPKLFPEELRTGFRSLR